MLAQHLAQCHQFPKGVHRAGRVARAVDHHHSGFWRDRRFQLRGGHPEALLDARLHDHRLAFGDEHDVGIGYPVRRGNDHLVAGVDHRQREVEETLLAAAGNQDLLRRVVQPVVALELRDDGLFERRRAADGGVFGEALVDRADRRVLDMLRCIEIRFARAQPDDVFAFRFQLRRTGGHGESGGRLDGLYASREFQDISLRFECEGELYPRRRKNESGRREMRHSPVQIFCPVWGCDNLSHSQIVFPSVVSARFQNL